LHQQPKLSEISIFSGVNNHFYRFRRAMPFRHRKQGFWPKTWISDILAATTPTPALAWAQRAATAGDDDDTAIPSCPVLVHFATIENVII